jgi:hypothetical protein
VVFHNVLASGEWVVTTVDIKTGKDRLLARGRQLAFGQPDHDIVPLYGPHWNPGKHRGLELLNVATGEIKETGLTPAVIKAAFPDWVKEQFGEKEISVFFPILAPDLQRVFFKIATPAGGDFRSRLASIRHGLLCYDLKKRQLLPWHGKWGHPSWHPKAREILDVGGKLIDSDTGKTRQLPNQTSLRGSHPSFSPDGKLFTTDVYIEGKPFNGPRGFWAVLVGDVHTGKHVVLHRFDNSKGAQSWRVSHPHPAFSRDGKRIYFNVSDGLWTRLFVAAVFR